MKSKIVWVAHAMENPGEDAVSVLKILITLQNKGVIAVAPYLNSYLYESMDNQNPNKVKRVQEVNRKYLLDGLCNELWIYGDSISEEILELAMLAIHVLDMPVRVDKKEAALQLQNELEKEDSKVKADNTQNIIAEKLSE